MKQRQALIDAWKAYKLHPTMCYLSMVVWAAVDCELTYLRGESKLLK